MLTVGDLFSGIGGFSLGLERTGGFKTIWFSEIDPYASAVLRKHWPAVPNLGDIRGISAATLADARRFAEESQRAYREGVGAASGDKSEADKWKWLRPALANGRPDVLCGGFPCQDISNAGKRAGIDGERSGLWSEFARLIGELRPKYVIVENVSALLGRGIERVLGDLSEIGYDAEWTIISARDVGAPHLRQRVWIVAYATGNNGQAESRITDQTGALERACAGASGGISGWASAERIQVMGRGADQTDVADAAGERVRRTGRLESNTGDGRQDTIAGSEDVADADSDDGHWRRGDVQMGRRGSASEATDAGGLGNAERRPQPRLGLLVDGLPPDLVRWSDEPEDVPRVAQGVINRVDQLRCLGNSIVPQIAEIIGRAIVSTA